MSISDPRASAWVIALDLVDLARKIREDNAAEELPSRYWAFLAEAGIYARLAAAETLTGISAGAAITDRQQEQAEQEKMQREAAEKFVTDMQRKKKK